MVWRPLFAVAGCSRTNALFAYWLAAKLGSKLMTTRALAGSNSTTTMPRRLRSAAATVFALPVVREDWIPAKEPAVN